MLIDVCNGSVFKSYGLFVDNGLTLKLILYQDVFEVVNLLGSSRRKHKMVSVSFTVANLEPFHCSCVDALQLMVLCSENDFKYLAQQSVFKDGVQFTRP